MTSINTTQAVDGPNDVALVANLERIISSSTPA